MIKFHCPHCATKISAEAKQFGITSNCPSCWNDITVPSVSCESSLAVVDSNVPVDTSLPENIPSVIEEEQPPSLHSSSVNHTEPPVTTKQNPTVTVDTTSTSDNNLSMHAIGSRIASFAKTAAHGAKQNSKIAVLKTRIQNAKQIELRKAQYGLGQKLYESRTFLGMQDEIDELERRITENKARKGSEENESNTEKLKRIGINAKRSAESEILALKLKQCLIRLGELARRSSQEVTFTGAEAEMASVVTVEEKIQTLELEAASRAAQGQGGDGLTKNNSEGLRKVMTRCVYGIIMLLLVVGVLAFPKFGKKRSPTKKTNLFVTASAPSSQSFNESLSGEEIEKIANNYYTGNGVPKNTLEAVKLFRIAANKGNSQAQFNLGVSYANGIGVDEDFVEAAKWYEKAANQNNAEAQNNLAILYLDGKGVIKSPTEAVKWIRKAAEQGIPNAQSALGTAYMEGEGVEQDPTEAVKWFQRAAIQGDAKAQNELAILYHDGKGVIKSPTEAVKWIRKAAEQGIPNAQSALGLAYMEGKGVEQDPTEAVKWYEKAANQNNADSQVLLGMCYSSGQGVIEDQEKAVSLFRKAAEQGNCLGQKYLGIAYASGQGFEKNNVMAYVWFKLAVQSGNVDSNKRLDMLTKIMTNKQLAEAKQIFLEWQPKNNASER